MAMHKRTLRKVIQQINQSFPVLLITGPRQVGKTTLLEVCKESHRHYVTLDDLDVRQIAQQDPALFFQMYPTPLIIDEVQYVPQLFSYIKMIVDKEKKKGLFWLTGSQKFHLMHGITESLAGRVAILDLLGLSNAELEGRSDKVIPFMPTPNWLRNFYFYRDFDQKQIDLLIESGDTLYPVEFKKTATPSQTASKHFHVLKKLGKKIGHGALICFVQKEIPLSRDVTAIPISYL
jgi:predicted AAA+ superfamily ATPase